MNFKLKSSFICSIILVFLLCAFVACAGIKIAYAADVDQVLQNDVNADLIEEDPMNFDYKLSQQDPINQIQKFLFGAEANGGNTLGQVIGFSRNDLINWVNSHWDGYYAGTPYEGSSIGNYHKNPIGDISGWGTWQQNYASSNCSGFIWHVLVGARYQASGEINPYCAPNWAADPTAGGGWINFCAVNGIDRRIFGSPEEMLGSGQLEKGDIIYVKEYDWEVSSMEDHFLIFWGDNPGDNVFMHCFSDGGIIISGFMTKGLIGQIDVMKTEHKGKCRMSKTSECDWSLRNKNYNLGDDGLDVTHYDIFTDSSCSNYTGRTINLNHKNPDGSVWGESGDLSCGRYYVRESQSTHGKNYKWNSTVGYVDIIPDTTVSVVFPNGSGDVAIDSPLYINNPIGIIKADFDSKSAGETLGSVLDFANAQYSFEYYEDYFITKEEVAKRGLNYDKTWTMSTDEFGRTNISNEYINKKVSGDEFYYDSSGNVICPLGSYLIHESVAPTGYLLSEKYYIMQVVSDSTSEKGVSSYLYDADNGQRLSSIIDCQYGDNLVAAYEMVFRGDYKFAKVNESMSTLPGIPFKITSKTTGEWHIVVTDENGCIDTSVNNVKHSQNTNLNDDLYDNNNSSITDETKLSCECGCWFSYDKSSGIISSPRDDCGALPYDEYTIEEICISHNEQYWPFAIKSFKVSKDGYFIDAGTWVNSSKVFVSEASTSDGKKEVEFSDNITVADKIFYNGLRPGQACTLNAWLVESDTENPVQLLDSDFDLAHKNDDEENSDTPDEFVSRNFVVDYDSGSVDISAEIDSRPYVDKNLVWYCELYDSESNCLLSQDKDPKNKLETLTVKNNVTPEEEKPVEPVAVKAPKTNDFLLTVLVIMLIVAGLISFSFGFIYIRKKKEAYATDKKNTYLFDKIFGSSIMKFSSNASSNSANFKKFVVAIIIIICLIGVLLFMNWKNWFDKSAIPGQYQGKSIEEIQKSLDLDVAEGEMNVSIAKTIKFPNGSLSQGRANIENLKANHLDQKVCIVLSDSGEVIYESGAIAPDYCIQDIVLNKDLDNGAHQAKAVFTGFDKETHKKIGSVSADIDILIG